MNDFVGWVFIACMLCIPFASMSVGVLIWRLGHSVAWAAVHLFLGVLSTLGIAMMFMTWDDNLVAFVVLATPVAATVSATVLAILGDKSVRADAT